MRGAKEFLKTALQKRAYNNNSNTVFKYLCTSEDTRAIGEPDGYGTGNARWYEMLLIISYFCRTLSNISLSPKRTSMIVYGIKNCGTVKKALNWLNENNIPFEFHDYKKQSVSKDKLQDWSRQLGWEPLINRKGTTWRRLDEAQKEKIKDEASAMEALIANTSMIRRPIIEQDGKVLTLGFDEEQFAEKLV